MGDSRFESPHFPSIPARMACSTGSCLSSMACPHPHHKQFFSPTLEFRQLALAHGHSRVKACRRHGAVLVASSGDSSSDRDEACAAENAGVLNRRALVAFLGIFAHTSLVSQSRADENLAKGDKVKGSRTSMDGALPDVQLNQAASSLGDFATPNDGLINLQVQAQEDAGDSLPGFINFLGYLGSGVLGGFYWLERQAKLSSVSALEDLTSKLKAKEDAMVSLKEQLEGKLLEERDQASQKYKEARTECETLSSELASVTQLTNNQEKELDAKKSMVENLEKQIDILQAAKLEAGKQKAILEKSLSNEQNKVKQLEDEIGTLTSDIHTKGLDIIKLRSTLLDKEKASADLSSRLSETTEDLSHAHHRIEELENEKSTITEKLSQSETLVQELRGKLAIAVSHGEKTEKKLALAHQELDGLKRSSVQQLKAVEGSLTSKVKEVEDLRLQLDDALRESGQNKKIICNLQEEISVLQKKTNEGNLAIEQLTGELGASTQALETAKAQIDSLTQELETTTESNNRLDKKILDVQQESELKLSSLKQALDHEHALSSKLNEELKKVKEDLDFSRREASLLNEQFKKLEISYKQLKKDFTESEEAVKVTGMALTKEKESAATNKKQLEAARKAVAEAKENIKFLRQDVERAKIEVDNMNKDVKELSKQLESANAKVASLETEKASLTSLLNEERRVSSNLREKVNQVDVALGKLSKEKETTTKRAKKLEGELASTKGEMLRMKKQAITVDTALKEAKSRVQSMTENSRSQEQSTKAAQISSEISSVQAELSQMQKSLEDAGRRQAEAEAAVGSLHDVMISQDRSAEDAVLVPPTSRGEEQA